MQLRVTLLFNFGGRAGAMLIGILIVPVYLQLLGLDGVGFIAFYTAIYGLVAIFDHALSTILIREVARNRGSGGSAQFTPDLFRTLELVTLTFGSIIVAAAFLFQSTIADFFFHSSSLPDVALAHCIVMMGAVIALQLLLNLQANMASALDRADLSNALTLTASAARASCSVAALLAINRSVETYFQAQFVALAFVLLTSSWLVWRAVPRAGYAKPKLKLLSDAMHDVPALIGNAIFFGAITQVDKLVVAKMLTVSDLGLYYLASTVAGLIWVPLAPIHLTLMPRFSALLGQRKDIAIQNLVHLSSQFLAVVIVPASILAILFSPQVLFLWTGQVSLSERAAPILSVLAVGTMLWALAVVPNVLQFAAGSARYSLIAGLIGVALIPAGAISSRDIGAIGPALVLVGAAIFQLFILPVGIFRRLKIKIALAWYSKDVGVQLIAAGMVGFVLQLFPIGTTDRVEAAVDLAIYFLILTFAVFIVSAELRRAVFAYVRTFLLRNTA